MDLVTAPPSPFACGLPNAIRSPLSSLNPAARYALEDLNLGLGPLGTLIRPWSPSPDTREQVTRQ
ncbi:hypothetical protein [Streptomyces melanogenes]|uniref:hypothetical protein n=1 Tax=Streptomyces melanogenes TaxID=67326 RepID=UPI00167DF1C7|nr:hypothetical protein [Streptomyces melanogenes]GGP78091.1 hypothetical protein GCM10010278_65600 [Streptomyces melanogenes]